MSGSAPAGSYAGVHVRNCPAGAVLIAEDDRAVRQSLERTLRLEGFDVPRCAPGVEAVEACATALPDVLILDVMMPEMDGLTACRELRRHHADLPILMLTARHEVGDRVAGLDAGADDYLVKPYASASWSPGCGRCCAARACPARRSDLAVGDLVVDPAARLAWRGDREFDLTKTEFDLLELLVFNAGIVLVRDTIYERIWGYDFETDVALARRLRRLPPRQDRSRPASRGWCTRCAASATSCASHDSALADRADPRRRRLRSSAPGRRRRPT